MMGFVNKKFLVLWGLLLFTFLSACTNKALDDRENNMPTKKIEEVLKQHTDGLMAIPGVVGVGQGLCDGKDCLKVFVVKITPELEQRIPKEIEGYSVEIVESGEIKPLEKN